MFNFFWYDISLKFLFKILKSIVLLGRGKKLSLVNAEDVYVQHFYWKSKLYPDQLITERKLSGTDFVFCKLTIAVKLNEIDHRNFFCKRYPVGDYI